MTMRATIVLTAFAAVLWAGSAVAADDAAPPAPREAAASGGEGPARGLADSVSHRQIDSAGQHIAYKATAGMLPIAGGKGEVAANVFYTAYEVEAAAGKRRPVTFVFNGGPGAASAFLHIGAMGPRVVPFNDTGSEALQPVHLIDNPDTWLPFTDLVFLDPVETGYSRAVGGEEAAKSKFFGIEKDADAMGEIARLYLTRTGRVLDPVFLVGESYGGLRAALLCKRLLEAGFDVRGAVLISPALEFSLIWGDDLGLLPLALALPSIALSHFEAAGKSAADTPSPQDLETFARGRYLTHLAAGQHDDPEIDAVLARDTGLRVEQIARHHSRISVNDYLEQTGNEQDRIVSRYDGSISVPAPRPAGRHNPDPVLDYAVATLGPAFAAYARNELGFKSDAEYQLLNRQISSEWDYGSSPHRQGYAGALDDLEAARTQRPSLRLMIASGLTDLVTPFATEHFLVDQMRPLDNAVPVTLKLYRGGHMMYLRAPSRAALSADARALYAEAMP